MSKIHGMVRTLEIGEDISDVRSTLNAQDAPAEVHGMTETLELGTEGSVSLESLPSAQHRSKRLDTLKAEARRIWAHQRWEAMAAVFLSGIAYGIGLKMAAGWGRFWGRRER